ncbi:hypothetical protein BJ741DRAFT_619338 [Chytriomyces cf. hyalinus JEL632]|nr:hypothetical protein BJ741DRAFT_619338 [Chytriomyces cf. hyalinus JEL632]
MPVTASVSSAVSILVATAKSALALGHVQATRMIMGSSDDNYASTMGTAAASAESCKQTGDGLKCVGANAAFALRSSL